MILLIPFLLLRSAEDHFIYDQILNSSSPLTSYSSDSSYEKCVNKREPSALFKLLTSFDSLTDIQDREDADSDDVSFSDMTNDFRTIASSFHRIVSLLVAEKVRQHTSLTASHLSQTPTTDEDIHAMDIQLQHFRTRKQELVEQFDHNQVVLTEKRAVLESLKTNLQHLEQQIYTLNVENQVYLSPFYSFKLISNRFSLTLCIFLYLSLM